MPLQLGDYFLLNRFHFGPNLRNFRVFFSAKRIAQNSARQNTCYDFQKVNQAGSPCATAARFGSILSRMNSSRSACVNPNFSQIKSSVIP